MTEDPDRQVIDLVDEFSNDAPSNFFERETTKETTTVRTMHFMLKSIVEQLCSPISTEAESVSKWLIYKQSGPHRHQKFFGYFRQMSRLLNRFNDMGLVKRLNVVLRKMENCGDNLYKLEKAAIRYMGCAYLRRVFLLEQIRSTCVKTANSAMGMLELAHWTNLCLVLVAICAEVHVEVVAQLIQMENAYKTGSRVFRSVDARFPESLGDLEVVKTLKKESGAFDDRKVDISAVSRLMKYSEQKMEQAQIENEMRMRRNEVLTELLSSELALETPKTTKTTRVHQKSISTPKVDLSDLGISINREDLSFLNSAVQSCSTAQPDDTIEDPDDVLFSPNLFKTKKSSKSTPLNTPKIKKNLKNLKKSGGKKKKSSFLSSTMSLFDD